MTEKSTADAQVGFGSMDWSGESFLEAKRVPQRVRDMFVVDFDFHVNDVPGAIAPYTEMPWRKSVEALGDGPFTYLNIPGWAPSQMPWQFIPESFPNRRSVVLTPEQARMDVVDLGIDYAILFPDNFLCQAALKDADYAVAAAFGYNRWLEEEFIAKPHDDGILAAILAPPQDPVRAAEEIRCYAGKDGFAAIYLPTAFVEPLWGHRKYDPIYDAAEETGMPVCFHANDYTLHPAFPYNLQHFGSSFGSGALGHDISLMANIISMMETGVFARFPKLKAVYAEGGIAWIPYLELHMDRAWRELRRHTPILKELPSTYARESVFVATQPIEEPPRMSDMAMFVEQIGADRVVFASDWPHHDFDTPAKILQIPVGEEAHRKIMGLNGARMLGLEAVVRS